MEQTQKQMGDEAAHWWQNYDASQAGILHTRDPGQIPRLFKWHQARLLSCMTPGGWAMVQKLSNRVSLQLLLHFREYLISEEDPRKLCSIQTLLLSSPSDSNSSSSIEGVAWASLFVGLTALRAGAVKHAVFWLQKCLQLASSRVLQWTACDCIGEAYNQEGNLQMAVLLREECVAHAFYLSEHLPPWLALSEHTIALFRLSTMFVSLGKYEDAFRCSNSVSELAKTSMNRVQTDTTQYADAFVLAINFKLRGHIAVHAGDFQVALEENKRALILLEGLQPDPAQVPLSQIGFIQQCMSHAHLELQQVHLVLEDNQAAAKAIASEEELSSFSSHTNGLEAELHILEGRATLAISEERLEDAEHFAAEFLLKSTSTGWVSEICIALGLLSKIAFSYQPKAETCLETIDSFLGEAVRLCGESARYSRALQLSLNAHSSYLMAFSKFRQAVEMLEKSLRMFMKTEFGPFSSGRITYLEAGKTAFRRIQLANFCDGEVWRGVVWAERARARDLLYGVSKGLYSPQDENELSSTLFDEDDFKAWEEIQSICVAAGEDTVFLIFTQLDSTRMLSYLLHATENTNIMSVICQLEVEPVEISGDTPNNGPVSITRALIDTMNRRDSQSSRRLLKFFYHIFISQWSQKLQKIKPKRMVVVPTEAVAYIPFAAFYDEDNREHLIEKYELVCVPSLRMFRYCEARQKSLNTAAGRTALVVGNPELDLLSADEEVDYVAQTLSRNKFNTVNLLKEAEATREAILEQFPNADWIHISCHGVRNEKFPFGSLRTSQVPKEIQVTPNQQRTILNFNEAGDTGAAITGRQVLLKSGPLKAACVVLSACQSGEGHVSSEGLLGLPRYLHLAGVPSVLVSLWNIDDAATCSLMMKLYTYLEQGQQLSTALRQSMLDMIKEGDEFPTYEVFDWASFMISGTPCVTLI